MSNDQNDGDAANNANPASTTPPVARCRVVTDINHITRTMWVLSRDQNSTNPQLGISYRNLPAPLRNVVEHTHCFNFIRRPVISPTDTGEYSQSAALLLRMLHSKAPLLASHPLLLVGFKCSYCATQRSHVTGSTSFVLIDERTMVPSLEASLILRLKHILACPLAQKSLPDSESVRIRYHEDFDPKDPNIRIFVHNWLNELKARYFPTLGMVAGAPSRPRQEPTPMSYPQIQPVYQYSSQGRAPRQSTVNSATPLEVQQALHRARISLLQQQSGWDRIMTVGPAAGISKAKRIVDLERDCDEELDHTVWSLFAAAAAMDMGYDSWDEEGEIAATLAARKRREAFPLPPPKRPAVDVWVPLSSREITECPEGTVPVLMSEGGQGTGRVAPIKPTVESGPNDVVICPPDKQRLYVPFHAALVEVAYESKGNRRFRELVSAHRYEYAKLPDDEKEVFANKLVQTIHERGGVFLKVVLSTDSKSVTASPESSTQVIACVPIVQKPDISAKNEALKYTMQRLASGFEDVFLASRLSQRIPPVASNDKKGRESKVLEVEHAPHLGLLHGYLKWDNGSKDQPRIKFSDVRIVQHESDANENGNCEANDESSHSHPIVEIATTVGVPIGEIGEKSAFPESSTLHHDGSPRVDMVASDSTDVIYLGMKERVPGEISLAATQNGHQAQQTDKVESTNSCLDSNRIAILESAVDSAGNEETWQGTNDVHEKETALTEATDLKSADDLSNEQVAHTSDFHQTTSSAPIAGSLAEVEKDLPKMRDNHEADETHHIVLSSSSEYTENLTENGNTTSEYHIEDEGSAERKLSAKIPHVDAEAQGIERPRMEEGLGATTIAQSSANTNAEGSDLGDGQQLTTKLQGQKLDTTHSVPNCEDEGEILDPNRSLQVRAMS